MTFANTFFLQVLALAALLVACQSTAIYPNGHLVGYEIYQPHYGYGDVGYGYEHGNDHYAYPKYKYSYGVKDPHTGDHKSQEEYRDGDVVKGHYTVADPDGTLRVVHYTADDHNGFNAVVEKHGQPVHPAPVVVSKAVPLVEKVVYEKPIYGGYGGYDHADYAKLHHPYGADYGTLHQGYGGYGY